MADPRWRIQDGGRVLNETWCLGNNCISLNKWLWITYSFQFHFLKIMWDQCRMHLNSIFPETSEMSAADMIPQPWAWIIDGMAKVQKRRPENIYWSSWQFDVHGGTDSQRIDVVFDVYRDNSIKNPERERREAQKAVMNSETSRQTTEYINGRNYDFRVCCVTSGSDTSGFVLMTPDIPEGMARANGRVLYLSSCSLSEFMDKQFLNVPLHVLCTFSSTLLS